MKGTSETKMAPTICAPSDEFADLQQGSIFDHWAEQFTTHLPLKDLENALGPGRSARIAIDAEHFISKYYSKEPLGGALGGDPLSLEEKMMVDLALLTQLGCQYFFYFHGCDYGHNDQYGEPFKSTRRFARNNAEAFDEYENAEPARAINIFRENGEVLPKVYVALADRRYRSGRHELGGSLAQVGPDQEEHEIRHGTLQCLFTGTGCEIGLNPTLTSFR